MQFAIIQVLNDLYQQRGIEGPLPFGQRRSYGPRENPFAC